MAQGLIRFPSAGCVVEFMQGNTPQIAWVLEEQGGRLRLLLLNRREMALQAARILPWAGPQYEGGHSREEALEKLEGHRGRRENLEEFFNPPDLWELANGEVERAPAKWFAELAVSDPDADAVAACGHRLLKFKSHFKFYPPEFEVLPAAVVEARVLEQEAAARREALLTEGSAFLRRLWEAHTRNKIVGDADIDPEVKENLRSMLLEHLKESEIREDGVWRQMIKGLPEDPFLALHLAVAWGVVPPHHNIWLDRAGYAPRENWADPFRAEVDGLRLRCERESREALTVSGVESPDFLSIDSVSTRDIDDAFHIRELDEAEGGGWLLTLALACPALHWPFGSELDKAVLHRATSLYLPEATHHMLPASLGADGFSLLAGKPRPALLVQVVVARDGSVRNCSPSFRHVRLRANLRYEDCEAALGGLDSPAVPYLNQLRLGLALAEARRNFRVKKGAVIIERPELRLILEGEGGDTRVLLEEEPPTDRAHLLVAEHMILINAALAAWAAEREVPLLHRTQQISIPKEYAGVWRDPVSIARVVRSLAPACLECTPRPHAGIGEPAYAPCTSPLRRYSDFLNEAQILHVVEHGVPRWSRSELEGVLPLLNSRLEAAAQVQRFRPRYWKYLHVRQKGDFWWPAIIIDENDAFVFVGIPAVQVGLRARRALFGERAQVGQEIEVRLGKVRPLQGEMSILEARDAPENLDY